MQQRRIVTLVSGTLALALGIALFYHFAEPGTGSRASGEDVASPAAARSPLPEPAAAPAAAAHDDNHATTQTTTFRCPPPWIIVFIVATSSC